jgi:hypothetical protein
MLLSVITSETASLTHFFHLYFLIFCEAVPMIMQFEATLRYGGVPQVPHIGASLPTSNLVQQQGISKIPNKLEDRRVSESVTVESNVSSNIPPTVKPVSHQLNDSTNSDDKELMIIVMKARVKVDQTVWRVQLFRKILWVMHGPKFKKKLLLNLLLLWLMVVCGQVKQRPLQHVESWRNMLLSVLHHLRVKTNQYHLFS